MIRLDILGPGEARDDTGKLLDLSGLPLALLAYLTVTARPVERDELATLFWPGSDPSRRRHSLRQALSRIRSAVPDEAFESDGQMIHIDTMRVETDRKDFLEALSAGRVAEAVELWRGILLEGFRRDGAWELGEWLERERTRLRDALIRAVLDLDAASDAEQVDVLESAHRALPLEQRIAARYARALIRSGRESEALLLVPLEDDQDSRVAWDEVLRTAEEAQSQSVRDRAEEMIGTDSEIERDPTGVAPRRRNLRPAAVIGALLLVASGTVGAAAIFGDESVEPTPATLFFCSDRAADAGGQQQLYRMNALGVEKHRVSGSQFCGARPVSDDAVVALSPATDGRRLKLLAADSTNPIAEWSLVPTPELDTLVDVRGFDVRLDPPGGAAVTFSAIALSDSTRDVFMWRPMRHELTRITDHPADDHFAKFGPEGSIIFQSYRSGDADLWIWSEDEAARPLVTSPEFERDPRPHGDTLLFLRGRGVGDDDGNIEIYLRDLSTGHETRITDNDWNDYNARWSPDGRYICWQSEEWGHYEMDIVVHDLETGETRTLAGQPGRQSECRWDPGSRGVYYSDWGAEGGEPDIYYVPLTGGAPINLSRYSGVDGALEVVPETLPDFESGT